MKIPVILITGFLGSGKTTLLLQIARTHPQWRLVFLVNEIADTSVDGDTLAASGSPTQSVVGGSLFCQCKASEFVRVLREQVVPLHQQQPLDAIVIETSGIADPAAIGQLFEDYQLSRQFEIRAIVTVVAPARFSTLIENLSVMESQLRACDAVIINKIDTVNELHLAEIEKQVFDLNPTAKIYRAQWCQLDLPFDDAVPTLPSGNLTTAGSNPVTTKTLRFSSVPAHEDFLNWSDHLPDKILRVKGNVQTDAGWFHLDKSVDTMELAPTQPQSHSALVLIVLDQDTAALRQARLQFKKLQA